MRDTYRTRQQREVFQICRFPSVTVTYVDLPIYGLDMERRSRKNDGLLEREREREVSHMNNHQSHPSTTRPVETWSDEDKGQ